MQLLIARNGKVEITDAPDPVPAENEVLIQTAFSSISPGTELQALSQQSRSLWSLLERGYRSYGKVKASLARRGWKQTLAKVSEAIDRPQTLGYSLAGRVTRVGAAVQDFGPGDWVTAVGPWAYHGTLVAVPRRFCAPIARPEMVRDASTAALACTAIHAVHRAELSAGAEVAVFGLGIIGQFTVQALCASGHRVVAFDPVEGRRSDAKTAGASVFDLHDFDFAKGSLLSSHGEGFDAVFLCARTESPDLFQQAARLCRKRGRLMVVGEFPINLPRESAYAKEIEIRFSAAYGDGRYDLTYERLDQDYPIAFARWTVERNLRLFVRWLEEGRIAPYRFSSRTVHFRNAPGVYQELADTPGGKAPEWMVLEYSGLVIGKPVLRMRPRSVAGEGAISVAVVGTGRFATETHLPNLRHAADQFIPHTLVGRSPPKAARLAEQFGFQQVTCNLPDALGNPEVAALLIATPHDLHADQVVAGLETGKHVFVEKPLCIRLEELDRIEKTYRRVNQSKSQVLFVGFNRRYTPLSQKLFEQRQRDRLPLEIRCEFQAPPLPPGEWYDRPEQGGRFVGEVCHAVDWIAWLVGAPVQRTVILPGLDGNQDIYLQFGDASRAHLRYRPVQEVVGCKERVEVSWPSTRWLIEDFLRLQIYEKDRLVQTDRWTSKGHREVLSAFAAAIAQPAKGDDPDGFFASSRLVLELDQALRAESAKLPNH